MEIELFIFKLKSTKLTPTHTGFFGIQVKVDSERTTQMIYKKDTCDKCKITHERGVMVEFFKPQQLTIFEAEMLFAIYVLNRKPMDYANYHKCKAGEEFIANIKSITEYQDEAK